MKKVIFALAAVVALAACSQEDVIVADKGAAIGFDTFVENSTRSVNDPSLTTATLQDFAVFGYVEGAVLFDGVRVAKNGAGMEEDDYAGQAKTGWKYEGTQYWITGAMYNFNAVAPFNGGWTMTTADKDATNIEFTNDGTTDLLYAKTPVIEGKASGNDEVGFNFRHALSKVKLSFVNQYNATNAKIMVKNIEITDPYKTANAVLTTAANWSDQATATDFKLNFGDATDNAATDDKEYTAAKFSFGTTLEACNELLMIPGAGATTQTINDVESKVYTITFVVELYQGESATPIKTYSHKIYTDFAPKAGMRYNLKAVITPENIDPNHQQEPIEFTVTEIKDWDNGNTADADVPADGVNDHYPLN